MWGACESAIYGPLHNLTKPVKGLFKPKHHNSHVFQNHVVETMFWCQHCYKRGSPHLQCSSHSWQQGSFCHLHSCNYLCFGLIVFHPALFSLHHWYQLCHSYQIQAGNSPFADLSLHLTSSYDDIFPFQIFLPKQNHSNMMNTYM